MNAREPTANIDFECKSACDIKRCGAWVYAAHPTTEILCLAFRLPSWAPGRTGLWTPLHDDWDADEVVELLQWIRAGRPVAAWNANFERAIWKHIQVPRYGWPAIDGWQFRCSAAKAAAHTLPRGLEDAAAVLKLSEQKDTVGHKLMLKLSKPRKPRKAERETWAKQHGTAPQPLLWWDAPADYDRLFAYCRADVLAEAAVSAAVPDLLPSELELYLIDGDINERGFQLDQEAVDVALELVTTETPKLNAELARLTSGAVAKATQRAKMLAWFAAQGLDLPNSQKDTIEETLAQPRLKTPVRRALELLQMLGKSSTAKYQSMRNWMGADGRVRGGLLFHAAGTGRWGGQGVQPQNFTKGRIKDQGALWTAFKTKDRNHIQQVATELSKGQVRDVLAALSSGLRGAIIAPSDSQLFVADFAAIEARVALWLADAQDALELFRNDQCVYLDMAKTIYGYDCDNPSPERDLSKVAVLGLGFGMGWKKFIATCEKWGITIDEEFAQRVVDTYREKYWQVAQMWRDQEKAAIAAVVNERQQHCGKMLWFTEGAYLYCQLPSGRRIAYPEPEIRLWPTSWGSEREALTFMGINPYTRKWTRQGAYGGLIFQNGVQSVARDLTADALRRCEASGIYLPVLSVHDEILAEVKDGTGDLDEFRNIVATVPAWAEGLPIATSGFTSRRYKK